ncbi:MAG: hypothetical protein MZV64_02150 [Ignavibacteriales bacterium]|nr:hypothetical protein [Ignavibacteriales bacterium]
MPSTGSRANHHTAHAQLLDRFGGGFPFHRQLREEVISRRRGSRRRCHRASRSD